MEHLTLPTVTICLTRLPSVVNKATKGVQCLTYYTKKPTWTPLFFKADPTNTGVKLLLIVAQQMAA